MSVAVTAIAFDHGRGQPGSYTAALRFNEVEPVLLPEWQRGSRFPSVAAYLRDRLPPVAAVLVRFAVSPGEPRLLEIQARSGPGGLLPDLPPSLIGFSAAGDSGWCALPLDTTGLSAGVNAVTQQWTWQLRRSSGESWMDFDATFHRTYVLLSAPTAPWLVWPPHPANTSLPRTDALDFACDWARGARDEIEAAALITEAVNRLGQGLLTYDAAVGAPHYTVLGVPRFLCDAFLDRLRGGDGAGPLVNCSDCATIVSTFANLLGADLWQSKMGLIGTGFRLNPILAIGSDQWSTVHGGFTFHEVAWSGECGELDTVYDACLRTDEDPDPTRAPHSPSLPVNQVFGTPGSSQYRDQIAAPADRDQCVPQPALRVRRPVSSRAIAFAPRATLGLHRTLAERARLEESAAAATEETLFEGFFFFGNELPGWSMARAASFRAAERPTALLADLPVESQAIAGARVLVSVWLSPDDPAVRLRVESIETASSAQAREALIRAASEIESPGLEPWDRGVAGETALQTPNGALVLFTRGNHVHVVRSAGREVVDVRKDVEALDRWLMGSGSPSDGPGQAQPVQELPGQPAPAHWKRIQLAAKGSDASRAAGPPQPGLRHRAVIGEHIVTAAHANAWSLSGTR
jgi:hypothetical protein